MDIIRRFHNPMRSLSSPYKYVIFFLGILLIMFLLLKTIKNNPHDFSGKGIIENVTGTNVQIGNANDQNPPSTVSYTSAAETAISDHEILSTTIAYRFYNKTE
ncbi:hypothetical protein EDEG_04043, partial [Edhazardia aedis USNM 41457]